MKKKDDNVLFFPSMGRCPFCGRFMKRGLMNWMNHTYDECISRESDKIRLFRKAITNI